MKANIFVNGVYITERHFEQVPHAGEHLVVLDEESKQQSLKVNRVLWLATDGDNVAELDCSYVVSFKDSTVEDLSLDRFKR